MGVALYEHLDSKKVPVKDPFLADCPVYINIFPVQNEPTSGSGSESMVLKIYSAVTRDHV